MARGVVHSGGQSRGGEGGDEGAEGDVVAGKKRWR